MLYPVFSTVRQSKDLFKPTALCSLSLGKVCGDERRGDRVTSARKCSHQKQTFLQFPACILDISTTGHGARQSLRLLTVQVQHTVLAKSVEGCLRSFVETHLWVCGRSEHAHNMTTTRCVISRTPPSERRCRPRPHLRHLQNLAPTAWIPECPIDAPAPASKHHAPTLNATSRVSPQSPMVLCEKHRQHSRLGGFGFHPRQVQRRDARRPTSGILATELSHFELLATRLGPVQRVAPRRRPSLQPHKMAHACVARYRSLCGGCCKAALQVAADRPVQFVWVSKERLCTSLQLVASSLKLLRNFLQTSTHLAR